MDWKGFLKGKKDQDSLYQAISSKPVPRHIAIIMDGNGRWAKARHMPRTAGHRQGVEALREIIKTSVQLKIAHLTLYAFSTENWKRPKSEIQALMSLMVEFLQKELPELHENKIRIYMLGEMQGLPEGAAREIQNAMDVTRACK